MERARDTGQVTASPRVKLLRRVNNKDGILLMAPVYLKGHRIETAELRQANLDGRVCLVLDPMLATGGSAVATVDILKDRGVKKIKYVGILAAPEGIQAMQEAHPDVPLHIAVIDDHLNENGYLVPGLGDAGDRQFGTG